MKLHTLLTRKQLIDSEMKFIIVQGKWLYFYRHVCLFTMSNVLNLQFIRKFEMIITTCAKISHINVLMAATLIMVCVLNSYGKRGYGVLNVS